MRVVMGVGLVAMLAACAQPETSGILATGQDSYAVETRGGALATAVERGLAEATSFCAAQGRQAELLRSRINDDSYQLAFRCAGGGASGGGPVIAGDALPPVRLPEPGLDLGVVGSLPGRAARAPGNPFGPAEPAPRAAAGSLPPLSSLPAAPPPLTAPFLPVVAPPFAPLVSPLAPPAASQARGSLPGASTALPSVAAPGRGVARSGPSSVPAASAGAPLFQPGVPPPVFWNPPPPR